MTSLVKGIFALVCALASGCTLMLSGSAMEGRVVDSETGAPIPGALVIVEWKGDIGGPVQSSQVCFHLEVVRTDEEGRYHVPAWHRRPAADWEGGFYGVRNTEVTRRTYRQGYTQLRYDPRDLTTILMSPYKGSVNDRLEYLAHAGTVGCGATDGSLAQEVMIWRAVCEEAKTYVESRVSQPKFRNQAFLQVVNNHIADIAKELQDFGRALNAPSIPCV
jgi:hypothetical protein